METVVKNPKVFQVHEKSMKLWRKPIPQSWVQMQGTRQLDGGHASTRGWRSGKEPVFWPPTLILPGNGLKWTIGWDIWESWKVVLERSESLLRFLKKFMGIMHCRIAKSKRLSKDEAKKVCSGEFFRFQIVLTVCVANVFPLHASWLS